MTKRVTKAFEAVTLALWLAAPGIAYGTVCEAITTCPDPITTSPTSSAGAVVTYVATCMDACGLASFVCTPPSGSQFPNGNTLVTCTCTGTMGEVGTCSFDVTVATPNTPPSFTIGADVSVAKGSGPQSVAGWVTDIENSTPPGNPNEAGQTVAFIVFNDNPALFSAQPAVSTNGSLSFTPAPNACGEATLSVVAQDSGGTAGGGDDTSDTQQATLTVTCNACPTADPLPVSVLKNSQVSFQLPGSDPESDALQYAVVQPPAHGSVTVQVQTGAATYAPTAGYCGPDAFTYRVNDAACTSAPATVSIDVVCALDVDVDVKPGSNPNSFKCRSTGVLPVGILGSATFDATTVDPSTVTLEAGGNVVGARRKGRGNKNDVNLDGFLDMVVEFNASSLADAIGCPLPGNTVVPVTIEGETIDAIPFKGTDTLRIAP